jgi:ParB-like chromosome segregation protein Spo0J
MAVPAVLSRDGILLDGHQRLRAELRNGKVFISANDVRIEERATADNALEWAVKLNMVRRHYTMEDKAQAARRLQAEYGWSQRTIADFFGVSQPAVSQWFATIDDEGPDEITGADGKRYPARRRPHRPKLPAAPALPDWVAVAGQLATMLPVHWQEVPAVHHAEARYILEELSEIIAAQLEMPERPAPFND